MFQARIRASKLRGVHRIPPSKSQTMRALIFAALAKGCSRIHNTLHSPDTDAMIHACRLMGAKIKVIGESLEIEGDLMSARDVINAGNSGLVLRFIGAVSALSPHYSVITGDDSIRTRRPVKPLLDGLSQLGAFAVSALGNDHAPIIIKGPLKGGTAHVDGEDSQPVSGLLIASAFADCKTELFVKNPGEKPFVAMTLNWFERLGIPYENDNYERYRIRGGAELDGFDYRVPGDWSSAAYPIAAALITGSELTIEGVDFSDAQGDKELVGLLQEMGAKIQITGDQLTVLPGSQLKGQKIDIGRFIDAITLLPVIGCFAEGKTEITGGAISRLKECDRIKSIVSELKKMGAKIVETEDGLIVEQSELRGAATESYADHRMAMSLTVAGLGATGETVVTGIERVAKSFPGFFDELRKLGANMNLSP
ncbi:MAG TPA: 3-phosphoshikimate 1-carboxyvinyltransferase [Rhabdochlamydiaceae bacterium]|nr:3-phosphoshikimate 1-carboxyvinyltransferase [Rhabdochlamydiaceae bacterium]